jgi:hypothetical protein
VQQVIRMRFDCPETGAPLSSAMDAGQWPGREDDLVSMHCPLCSKLHSFERSQAILAAEPAEREAAGMAAAY